MIFTIAIFPKGRKVDKTPALYFDSQEQKDNYVVEEGKFCMKEYDNYLTSNYSVREKYQIELDKKRIAFAVHKGFAKSKGNKFKWVITEPEESDEPPKRYA